MPQGCSCLALHACMLRCLALTAANGEAPAKIVLLPVVPGKHGWPLVAYLTGEGAAAALGSTVAGSRAALGTWGSGGGAAGSPEMDLQRRQAALWDQPAPRCQDIVAWAGNSKQNVQ